MYEYLSWLKKKKLVTFQEKQDKSLCTDMTCLSEDLCIPDFDWPVFTELVFDSSCLGLNGHSLISTIVPTSLSFAQLVFQLHLIGTYYMVSTAWVKFECTTVSAA